MTLKTILLTFANPATEPLPTLREEDDALYDLLAQRAQQRHFFLHRESHTEVDELPTFIGRYRNDLAVFHFSGHAGRDRLVMGDGDAHGGGLAQLLGQCPQLKLVVLNGCSTAGLVAAIQKQAGAAPLILATSAPVQDSKATYFSSHFYEALFQQCTIGEAFALAQGALQTRFSDAPEAAIHRSVFAAEEAEEDDPVWGLYATSQNEHLLDWRLPNQPEDAIVSDFVPNQALVDALFSALSVYHDDVRRLYQQERNGVAIAANKKRMAVLNALPAPLGEPLRKLMVPVSDENEGYDKVSEARLRQMVQAYGAALELLAFVLLAQLWELYYADAPPQLSEEEKKVLASLFKLSRAEREQADLLKFVQAIREIFERHQIEYFIEELKALREIIATDKRFNQSVSFLSGLRRQVAERSFAPGSLGYLCKTAEECLAYLYSRMSFMARYRLATIQGIDVQKYRHRPRPSFNHTAVMLHDLLGGFDVSWVTLDRSLDNRSVLLINEENWAYLNLSPFVIDENAFEEKTDVCKLYFFSHYLPGARTFCFKYMNKPDDPLLEVNEQRHGLVKEQFEVFAQLILQQPLPQP